MLGNLEEYDPLPHKSKGQENDALEPMYHAYGSAWDLITANSRAVKRLIKLMVCLHHT